MTRFIGFLARRRAVARARERRFSGRHAADRHDRGRHPYTGGQTDNGFEGFRFVGYQIYEPLITWDLSQSDKLPRWCPGSRSRGR